MPTEEKTRPAPYGWTDEPCCAPNSQWRRGGVTHTGSAICKSGSPASGGNRAHCTCDACY